MEKLSLKGRVATMYFNPMHNSYMVMMQGTLPDLSNKYDVQVKRMSKVKVLFLCTSNSARSQMAEAFLRSYAGDNYEAYSAGLEPKRIHPLTTRVMDEVGIDISRQYTKALKDYMGKVHFGYLITVCNKADEKCPTAFPGMGQRLSWSFEDPARLVGTEEERLNKFREIRDQISQKIRDWVLSR